jgi:hypothetical protein
MRDRPDHLIPPDGRDHDQAGRSVEVPALARHTDPSLPGPKGRSSSAGRDKTAKGQDRRLRVEWVPATQVLTGRGTRLGSWAVLGWEATARRARRGLGHLNPISRRRTPRQATRAATPREMPRRTAPEQDQSRGLER